MSLFTSSKAFMLSLSAAAVCNMTHGDNHSCVTGAAALKLNMKYRATRQIDLDLGFKQFEELQLDLLSLEQVEQLDTDFSNTPSLSGDRVAEMAVREWRDPMGRTANMRAKIASGETVLAPEFWTQGYEDSPSLSGGSGAEAEKAEWSRDSNGITAEWKAILVSGQPLNLKHSPDPHRPS